MRTIVETLDPDVPYRLRHRLGPWLTHLARTLGRPEYRLYGSEYVGTVHRPVDEFTSTLQDLGFDWDPLAWYHQPPVGAEPNGSWTYRRTLLADRQLHVILIAHGPAYIDVFAHEEPNWLRHPVEHLLQRGIERHVGRRRMRRWLDRHGVAVETNSRGRRWLARKSTDLRRLLGSVFGRLVG